MEKNKNKSQSFQYFHGKIKKIISMQVKEREKERDGGRGGGERGEGGRKERMKEERQEGTEE